MKKAEKILGAIAIISIILNLLNIPFIEKIMLMSLSALSLLYMYLGQVFFKNVPFRLVISKENFTDLDKMQKFSTYVMGWALALTITGIIFKIQGWPYMTLLSNIGITGLIISTIISLLKYNQSKSTYLLNILKRAAIIGSIGILFLFVPPEDIFEIKYRNHPEYVEALKKAWADPENQELWKKVKEERLKMHNE